MKCIYILCIFSIYVNYKHTKIGFKFDLFIDLSDYMKTVMNALVQSVPR